MNSLRLTALGFGISAAGFVLIREVDELRAREVLSIKK